MIYFIDQIATNEGYPMPISAIVIVVIIATIKIFLFQWAFIFTRDSQIIPSIILIAGTILLAYIVIREYTFLYHDDGVISKPYPLPRQKF